MNDYSNIIFFNPDEELGCLVHVSARPDKLIYKNKENLNTTFIGSWSDVHSVDIVYHTGRFSHIRPRFM